MRTVTTADGTTYLLLKESSDSSLVRDPQTGAESFIPNADLEPVDEPALVTAASAVPEPLRRLVTATHTERTLGLLVDLHQHGPRAVRGMLETHDLCESDLLGAVTEFRAAGLVEETTVAGERGYRLTETGTTAIEALLA
jgi:hypothetical protein